MNMRADNIAAIGGIGAIGLVALAAAAGWVMNLVKLFGALNDPITGMMIARAVGVFLAPIGAVLGWF